MNAGFGGGEWSRWYGTRHSLGPNIKIWRRMTGNLWMFMSEDGGIQKEFRPCDQKAHTIRVVFTGKRDMDAIKMLDNIKYFPELRELRIYPMDSIGNHLSFLRYCPFLKTLIVSGARGCKIGIESLRAISTLTQLQ